MSGGMQFNFSTKGDAAVRLAIASHFLAGAADTLSSETDTVIAAVALAVACIFYTVSQERGYSAAITGAALSCAFLVHALLEANKFTNTFVWVATGVSLITLVNTFAAFLVEKTYGRYVFEAASTYAVSLVAFTDDEYAVLTRALGLLLSGTSLLVLVTVLWAKKTDDSLKVVAAGNQFAFGATIIGHSAYYVLREAEEKSVYGQFVALAVFVSTSAIGNV